MSMGTHTEWSSARIRIRTSVVCVILTTCQTQCRPLSTCMQTILKLEENWLPLTTARICYS